MRAQRNAKSSSIMQWTVDGFRGRYAYARAQADSGLISIKLVIGQEKDFVLLMSRPKSTVS